MLLENYRYERVSMRGFISHIKASKSRVPLLLPYCRDALIIDAAVLGGASIILDQIFTQLFNTLSFI